MQEVSVLSINRKGGMRLHRTNTKDEKSVFFKKLFEDNYRMLLKFAYFTLPEADPMIAEDIVQRTFYEAWKNIDMLLTYPNTKGWLLTKVRERVRIYNENVQSEGETSPANNN